MLKVNFFHTCDKTEFDQKTGKLSIIGIFTNINAPAFPAVHQSMSIVVGLEEKPGKYDVELEFLDEKGTILKVPAKVQIGLNGRGVWVHNITGYQIPREATQKIKLYSNKEVIYSDYITINNK